MTASPGFGDPRRWAVFAVGFAALITGIGLSITADLGVGSWQVFETGLVEATGLGFGAVILAEAFVALAIAWVWFGERPWIATALLALGGIPLGMLIDALGEPEHLAVRVVMLGGGSALIAVGVAFYLASSLGASAQDALFVGFYRTYDVRPRVVRFWFDFGLVVAGFLLGGQLGVGTIAVTFLVPALIEPSLQVGHRLADTPLPASMERARNAPPTC